MKRAALRLFFAISTLGLGACYVQGGAGAGVATTECNSAEVHNRHDVETCRTRCGDDGCRNHCTERESWSREHHCWTE